MWKNIVNPDRPQVIWRKRIVCWVPKATNTHSQYVMYLLHKGASMLRCTYIASLVNLPEQQNAPSELRAVLVHFDAKTNQLFKHLRKIIKQVIRFS